MKYITSRSCETESAIGYLIPNGTGGKEHTCEEFERGICNRFGNEGLDDIVEGFTKLRQENIVEEYYDEFEDMRIRMESLMLN